MLQLRVKLPVAKLKSPLKPRPLLFVIFPKQVWPRLALTKLAKTLAILPLQAGAMTTNGLLTPRNGPLVANLTALKFSPPMNPSARLANDTNIIPTPYYFPLNASYLPHARKK